MKRIGVFIIVLMALPLGACGKSKGADKAQIADPWVVVDSVKEAQEKAGIEFKIPETVPEGYQEGIISMLDERIIQIIYYQSEHEMIYRTGVTKGDEDTVSGDGQKYQVTDQVSVGKVRITLYGDGKDITFAKWADEDYDYSLSSEEGFTIDQVREVAENI